MGLKENAELKLIQAYQDAIKKTMTDCHWKEFIDFVIDNTHLTYKYVLFTELLAKATDQSINQLCLQKKSTLPGSYDARTICHKVIVPFEMETLEKALGGSNEPFLNKPARFPELNKNNAVRRGNDQDILNKMVDTLPLIKTSNDAYSCLVYLISKLIKIKEQKKSSMIFSVADCANLPTKLYTFIERLIEDSFEGESLTLAVAGIYYLAYRNYKNSVVEVHPVNQSGASGKEVSDLDVYIDNKLVSSNELKDKDYSETDVRHAADKVINAGGNHMLFISGPRANPTLNFIEALEEEYLSRNFLLKIIPYDHFFSVMIALLESIDIKAFMKFLFLTAQETKFKKEVIEHMDKIAIDVFGLSREQ